MIQLFLGKPFALRYDNQLNGSFYERRRVIIKNNEKLLSGNLDIDTLFNRFVRENWLNPSQYIYHIQLGVEVTSGYGAVRINRADINFNTIVLPTQLLLFKAALNNEKVIINWKVEKDLIGTKYTLYNSIDGIKWNVINEFNTTIASLTTKQYTYTLQNPPKGISYYKLKITDIDGQIKYSSIEKLKIESNRFNTYPNPAKTKLHVECNEDERHEVKIFNLLGQNIPLTDKITLVNNALFIIDVRNFPKGIYVLKVKGKSKQITIE